MRIWSIYWSACAHRLLSVEQSICCRRQLLTWENGRIRFVAVSMIVVFVSSTDAFLIQDHIPLIVSDCSKQPKMSRRRQKHRISYPLYYFCFKGLLAFILPCYVQGKIAEGVGESCCLHCICALLPLNWYCLAKLRQDYREQRGITVSTQIDVVATKIRYMLTDV